MPVAGETERNRRNIWRPSCGGRNDGWMLFEFTLELCERDTRLGAQTPCFVEFAGCGCLLDARSQCSRAQGAKASAGAPKCMRSDCHVCATGCVLLFWIAGQISRQPREQCMRIWHKARHQTRHQSW